MCDVVAARSLTADQGMRVRKDRSPGKVQVSNGNNCMVAFMLLPEFNT